MSPSSSNSAEPDSSSRRTRSRSSFYVQAPPRLGSEERRQYLSMTTANSTTQADEIVGEFIDNDNIACYYARYKKGPAHKFLAEPFQKSHPNLIKIYERRKAEGDLPAFNPLASSHSKGSSPGDPEIVPDSEEDEDDEGADDDYGDDGSEPPVRRSTRQKPIKLPFSPKKTRSQRIFTQLSDEEDFDDSGTQSAPVRRSTRNALKVNLRDASYSDASSIGEESDDFQVNSSRSKAKPKVVKKRAKASRPAYGHFRSVDELDDEDYDDYDEESVMHLHRKFCEKCHSQPAHILLNEEKKKRAKGKGRKKSKKKGSDDDLESSEDELEKLTAKGGWVRCLKCPVAAHFKCITLQERDEILLAARARDRLEWINSHPPDVEVDVEKNGPKKRPGLDPQQMTDFLCSACSKGGFCIGCQEETRAVDPKVEMPTSDNVQDTVMTSPDAEASSQADKFLFRCLTCKRVAHYEHLVDHTSEDFELIEKIRHYQQTWLCDDCSSFVYPLDAIIAWRPYPPNAVESEDEPVKPKDRLPREYLVKWQDRSFRRLTWVPHMWLVSTNYAKLRNFILEGTKFKFRDQQSQEADISEPASIFDVGESSVKAETPGPFLANEAYPNAEQEIPKAWKTVDRVLDILIWSPPSKRPSKKGERKRQSKVTRIDSDEEEQEQEEEEDPEEAHIRERAFRDGEQPGGAFTETLEDWESRTGLDPETLKDGPEAGNVIWGFFKWKELGYDSATWDSPPQLGEPGYSDFQHALARYIAARQVKIPRFNQKARDHYEKRPLNVFKAKHRLPKPSNLDLGQAPELKLMDFQVDGFNWLGDNWWNKQPSIIADEMGLGKTVQIATFIGYVASHFQAFPVLVVVPNSTITNWVREFERWAPRLRVIPFSGEAKSREVVKRFELGLAGFHVLITTYETVATSRNNRDFSEVFKAQTWKVLVIDEGQRLKSDESLLFKKLNEITSLHRIIMTGTPLNNNIRELFNLMNFLDRDNWDDLIALEKEYEELTEDLVKQLHERLRPYFLRRLKSDVLTLPPKNEVIVPVSMAPLQKEVYRSILTHNANLLKGLAGSAVPGTQSKTKINNILMQLRKCLQHPYLFSPDIEPVGLSNQESHDKLIDGSAKLRFLKLMLPKLKARGHRVLLFSQFVIALDVLQDFLNGEGYKYLRLDGNTKGSDRQKGMDDFNRPGSDVFIYLLSTRAGGVGINLFTADTVIIFDPDFNPHQDLQAIARSYRFGQTKTCLVFKLMVKDSAEERIMQIGKKKLVLDHLIVQKMDADEADSENVQSILTFGAQALFESEGSVKEIVYNDNDIDSLIDKTEQAPPVEEKKTEKSNAFSFAKIWTSDKDLEELRDEDQGDSWAETLQKITADQEKMLANNTEPSGRGTRRRAAQIKPQYAFDSPEKVAGKAKKNASAPTSAPSGSDASSYLGDSDIEMDDTSGEESDAHAYVPQAPKPAKFPKCGLCGERHGDNPGDCHMTDKSENLVEYRLLLMLHADDEPIEARRAAIKAIDETLAARGHVHMIQGQPLHLVDKALGAAVKPKKSPAHDDRGEGSSKQGSRASSSSKRPSSPTAVGGPAKKPRTISGSCPLCNLPAHELEQCAIVLLGPTRLLEEIARLEEQPGMQRTVDELRKILSRQKRQAAAIIIDD